MYLYCQACDGYVDGMDCHCGWTQPDLSAEYENWKLKARIEELEGALLQIKEYWNRDNNEQVMEDACWKVIEIVEGALTK